jgi:hypothetical protein
LVKDRVIDSVVYYSFLSRAPYSLSFRNAGLWVMLILSFQGTWPKPGSRVWAVHVLSTWIGIDSAQTPSGLVLSRDPLLFSMLFPYDVVHHYSIAIGRDEKSIFIGTKVDFEDEKSEDPEHWYRSSALIK